MKNPYAGRYVEDIQPMMDALKPLGREMAARLVAALGGAERIQGYGKGALVGLAGELEHGALWHVPGGYGMRDLLEGSHAIVPSTTQDRPGRHGHRHSRSITASPPTCAAISTRSRCASPIRRGRTRCCWSSRMTTGPRPHARVGGLRADEIAKFDGQR